MLTCIQFRQRRWVCQIKGNSPNKKECLFLLTFFQQNFFYLLFFISNIILEKAGTCFIHAFIPLWLCIVSLSKRGKNICLLIECGGAGKKVLDKFRIVQRGCWSLSLYLSHDCCHRQNLMLNSPSPCCFNYFQLANFGGGTQNKCFFPWEKSTSIS